MSKTKHPQTERLTVKKLIAVLSILLIVIVGAAFSPSGKPIPQCSCPAQLLQSATTVIANDEIKTLPSTYVELVPAPGANKEIIFMRAVGTLSTPSGGYLNISDPAAGLWADFNSALIISHGNDDGEVSNYAPIKGYFEGGNGRVSRFLWTPAVFIKPGVTTWDRTYAQVSDPVGVNKPLKLVMYNAAGDLTSGDPSITLTIIVFYTIIDV